MTDENEPSGKEISSDIPKGFVRKGVVIREDYHGLLKLLAVVQKRKLWELYDEALWAYLKQAGKV